MSSVSAACAGAGSGQSESASSSASTLHVGDREVSVRVSNDPPFIGVRMPTAPFSFLLSYLPPEDCGKLQATCVSNHTNTGIMCFNEAERLAKLMDTAVPTRDHMKVFGLTPPFDIPDMPEKEAQGNDYLVWQEVKAFKARVGALALKKLHDLLPPKSPTVTSVELQLKAYKEEQELSLMHFTNALDDEHLTNLLATINAGRAPAEQLDLDALKTALGADIPAYITEIRAWFQNPESSIRTAQALVLYGKGLKSIPPEIGRLVGLKRLYLHSNPIRVIPPEIGRLVSLKELVLSHTSISVIPPEIGRLVGLQRLTLDSNQIRVIPPEIGRLVGLQVLNLVDNQISVIPPELCGLLGLQELWLRRNRIRVIPPELCRLVSLKELDLLNNLIRVIPPEIGRLVDLQALDLRDNRLVPDVDIPVAPGCRVYR